MDGLVLRNLGRRFGAFDAVADLNLHIKPGEFVSLLGPSGCGKTTTLRMIAGFIDPTAGAIELNGKLLSAPDGSVPPEKRGMSMIFQSYAIWPNMTVAQNVSFGLKLRKLPREEVRRRTGEILEVVRMSHLADRYPSELSGGQQQRIALARAIVVRPALLLLDEPLSNLDANLREEMRFEIKRMHDEFKITSVYVTHDQSEAMVTSDRIAVMNKGLLEQIDTPYALYTRPRTRFVASFIGRTNFIAGHRSGDLIDFTGFSVPMAAINGPVASSGELTASIRPEAMRLTTEPSSDENAIKLEGTITRSAFLGEAWDYVFRSRNSDVEFKVAAPPSEKFEVGGSAWLQIDPRQVVPITD
ncbi:ABC transporter ATP-binding protein [Aquamicrobium sp. LC103]|uniref:ABC transporter ATP-binding protein n=1 Tax=Aquamicrobium sp. LC103 TaxID=1120658 RepID=UPI00063E6F3C|nr:ABC transporter ATP-binding protein [Aquamicrobium sp. LC103]TKT82491.1 ABC transporter ATP-binding protein [Aquamicrobium sp. LC103]